MTHSLTRAATDAIRVDAATLQFVKYIKQLAHAQAQVPMDVETIEQLANAQYGPALLALARLYQHGDENLAIAADHLRAFSLFAQAAAQGEAWGYFSQAWLADHELKGDFNDAQIVAWYEASIADSQQAAQLGLHWAYNNLSNFYFAGRGVARDVDKGLAYLQHAASLGNVMSHHLLARIYAYGEHGIEKNAALAFQYALAGSNRGGDACGFLLGEFYYQGLDEGDFHLAVNYDKARLQFLDHYDYGRINASLHFYLGYLLSLAPEQYPMTLALREYGLAILGGNRSACRNLGDHYRDGDGVPADLKKAEFYYWYGATELKYEVCWQRLIDLYKAQSEPDYELLFSCYQQAVSQGHMAFYFDMGTAYFEGWGVTQDTELAFAYWRLAAQEQHPTAAKNLAICYHNGLNCQKHLPRAVFWYQKALAIVEDAVVYFDLGCAYQALHNQQAAFESFRAAAELGLTLLAKEKDGQQILDDTQKAQIGGHLGHYAYLLHQGEGGEVNLQQALNLYELALLLGDEESAFWLAQLDVLLDYPRGQIRTFALWQQALSSYPKSCHYQLARCYHLGAGCEIDLEQAVAHYQHALALGCEHSEMCLRVLLGDQKLHQKLMQGHP
ncbi:tetratricopeptide repeat protein [Vibrio stylophorae]|uniref:tetratricopeptide repeat protein n=1 Tax=Vibrio stylophorae TaxID=659351 RepID=UPI001F288665|nr:tetratricopeptide repeat protein [Vibrio stylophorae]